MLDNNAIEFTANLPVTGNTAFRKSVLIMLLVTLFVTGNLQQGWMGIECAAKSKLSYEQSGRVRIRLDRLVGSETVQILSP